MAPMADDEMNDGSDDPFSTYQDSYEEAVADAIGFSHQGHEFYTRAKVRHLVRLIGEHVGDPSRQEVLDVGCGPGVTDSHLAPMVGSLTGTDVSKALLDRAVTDNPTIDYRLGDGDTLPFEDASFDVTFTICVLHHVDESSWAGFAKEMARVTRPGGIAVVFEHNPWNPLTRRAVSTCPFDEGVTLLGHGRTSDLLEGAELAIVDVSHILYVPVSDTISDRADRLLGWLPLGGQYYAVGRVVPGAADS